MAKNKAEELFVENKVGRARPLFSRTIRTDADQMVFLDIYEKDDPTVLDCNRDPVRRKYLSVCEFRKNDKGNFDRILIHLRSKDTIRGVRDALSEVLIYLDSFGG